MLAKLRQNLVYPITEEVSPFMTLIRNVTDPNIIYKRDGYSYQLEAITQDDDIIKADVWCRQKNSPIENILSVSFSRDDYYQHMWEAINFSFESVALSLNQIKEIVDEDPDTYIPKFLRESKLWEGRI